MYTNEKFLDVCQECSNPASQIGFMRKIEVLALIVSKYTLNDLSKELLANVFVQQDEFCFLNAEFTLNLMRNRIISISNWDNHLSIYLQENVGQLS